MNRTTGINPNNELANELTKKRRKYMRNGPSVIQRYKWHEEFIEKGLDKKMSFTSYLGNKTKEFFRLRHERIRNKANPKK